MGTPSITPPAPPAKPVLGATPRIASIPSDASTLPSDRQLRTDLRALTVPGRTQILAAFDAFGDVDAYRVALQLALTAIGHPVDTRLTPAIARLSAEAYLLDVHLYEDLTDPPQGYIDRFDQLPLSSAPTMFIHFVVRRMIDFSSADMSDDMRRSQLERALEVFGFIQRELDAQYALYIGDHGLLSDYRQVLFEVVWKYYQQLFDAILGASTRSTAYKRAVQQLADLYFAIRDVVDLEYDPKNLPAVAAYHIEKMELRDMFAPDRSNAFGFSFFGKSAPPLSGSGPQLTFPEVVKKRKKQLDLLADIQPGVHPPGSAAFPDEPPMLHDNRAWQAWIRKMWDTHLRDDATYRAVDKLLAYIHRYFDAFTNHVPWDLDEGSSTANYLTRKIPRAFDGALVHDCLVYAIRWIFMLGKLFAPATIPSVLANSRISVIEMPVHVGVMIRVDLPLGKHLVIAINNQSYSMHEDIASADGDDKAVVKVVSDMYAGVDTPVVIHQIKSDITSLTALWREVAAIADHKLKLPYDSPDEPWLEYLELLKANATIQKELNGALDQTYVAVRKAAHPPDGRPSKSAVTKALSDYQGSLDEPFTKAATDADAQVPPIVQAIENDLANNERRIPKDKGAIVVTPDAAKYWPSEALTYGKQVTDAIKSVDVTDLDPDDAFPGDSFPSEAQ